MSDTIQIPESKYYELFSGESNFQFVIEDYEGDCYRGDTIEEAIAELAHSYQAINANSRRIRVLTARYEMTSYLDIDVKKVAARVAELNAERNAKNNAAAYEAKLAAWNARLQELNDSAGDYSEQGYQKRYEALLAEKPVKP